MDDERLRWQVVERTDAGDYRVFRTRVHRARHPQTARERTFSVIEAPDWVNVIALTPDDEVVLVRQFRHGTEMVTVEIPGGAVDPGEDHEGAAVRELREETGYRPQRVMSLGVVEPNPALQSNRCATFLALDCVLDGPPRPDDGEVLALELRSLAEVGAMLRDGRIAHALVVAAFGHLMLATGGRLARPDGA